MTRKAGLSPYSIRLSAQEKLFLQKKAGDQPLSIYIRSIILDCPEERKRYRSKNHDIIKDHAALAKILGLLGQLNAAKHLKTISIALENNSLIVTEETDTHLHDAAKALNEDGIPSPSKKGWLPSTINGNRERGTGILNNELYIGRLIWNKLRYIKNPDTGKRVSRLNPREDWIIKEVPELQIVDMELWEKVKIRQQSLTKKKNLASKRRPKLLFSGLLKCGCCGGGFTKISKTHYGCFSARKKAMCDNFETIRQDQLENTILSVLQKNLMNPDMCAEFCAEYAKYMNELRMHHNAQKANYEKELQKRIRDDDRLIQMVVDGIASTASMKERINSNAQRIEELKSLLEDQEEMPILLHPNMGHHYQKEVKALLKSLNSPDHRYEAADLIRGLIDKVVLTPREKESGLYIDLKGDLAGILTMATKNKTAKEQKELIEQIETISEDLNKPLDETSNTLNTNDLQVQDMLVAGGRTNLSGDGVLKMVAGAGFEPATFRL